MRVWAPGWMRALSSLRAAAAYSVSMISVDLPEPETPVTQVRRPIGISAVTFCRLFSVAPTMRIALPFCGARRLVGSGICRAPERYCPVRLVGVGEDVVGRALGDHLAAVDAGAGADVDDVVGLHDGVLVVLDDDHRVADVAQVLERAAAGGRCRAGAGRWTARRARTTRR